MTKLSNLPAYQSKYLRAADLQGRPVRVTIERVTIDELRDRSGAVNRQAVVWMVGKQKGLVINKTRLAQLIEILGTDESDGYIGSIVMLHPTKQSGKDTIAISAVPDD